MTCPAFQTSVPGKGSWRTLCQGQTQTPFAGAPLELVRSLEHLSPKQDAQSTRQHGQIKIV